MPTQGREDASNIRAVILDYGQVLVRSPTRSEFGRMADIFRVTFETFYQLWERSRDPYDRGDLTPQQYWLKLAEQTKTSITAEQIETLRQVEIDIWCHTYPDMLDWLKRLHVARFKTALLSNMPVDLMKYVLAKLTWMENFSFRTFPPKSDWSNRIQRSMSTRFAALACRQPKHCLSMIARPTSKPRRHLEFMRSSFDRLQSSEMTWTRWAFPFCPKLLNQLCESRRRLPKRVKSAAEKK